MTVWPLPRSLATTNGISVDFSSSPYLDVSVRAVPPIWLCIHHIVTRYCRAGFPHSEISGSTLMCSSPKLIAACHVLHRLLMPRHSPCALSSLTSNVIHYRRRIVSSSSRIMQACHKEVWFHCFYPNKSSTIRKLLSVALLVYLSHCSVFKVQLLVSLETRFKQSNSVDSLNLPSISSSRKVWWAQVDSNHRPHDYQSCALTS